MKRKENYLKSLTILGLVAVFAIAGADSANAQNRSRRVRTVQTSVAKKLPKGHVAIRVNGNSFFYHKGVFYGRRTAGYAVVSAPLGAVVRKLPRTKNAVRIGRTKYLVVNGTYYIKVKKGYRVVRSPAGERVSWGAAYDVPIAVYGIPGFYFSTGLYYAYSPVHKRYAFTFGHSQWSGKHWRASKRRLARNDARLSAPRASTARAEARRERNRSRRRVD